MALGSVAITAGAGTNIAVDIIAAKNYPFSKIVDGTTDSVVPAVVRTTQAQNTDGGLVVRAIIDQDNSGSAVVTDAASLAAGTANLAQCIAQMLLFNGTSWIRGGATPYKLLSAATTNLTSVVGAACALMSLSASNSNASIRYLKIYDKASAPVLASDTPKHTFLLPGNTSGAGSNLPLPMVGIKLVNGLALAIVSGIADNDTGAVGANDVIVNLSTI